MTAYLQGWAVSLGAPPEVTAALVLAATAPLPPVREALARAVVALEAEAVRNPGGMRGWVSEFGARAVLTVLIQLERGEG